MLHLSGNHGGSSFVKKHPTLGIYKTKYHMTTKLTTIIMRRSVQLKLGTTQKTYIKETEIS